MGAKYILFSVFILTFFTNCSEEKKSYKNMQLTEIQSFTIENTSIRALTLLDGQIAFAGSNAVFGLLETENRMIFHSSLKNQGITADFRSVAASKNNFFMLSVANPAMIFTAENNQMNQVYYEENSQVFYDAMLFLNNDIGIAVGDPIGGKMAIISTQNGGKSWKKITENAPTLTEGEAIFAASNSSIAFENDQIYIVTGGKNSRIFSTDKTLTHWKSSTLPIIQGEASQGGFSLAFHDKNNGIVMGGDYKNPTNTEKTGCITTDGGVSWKIILAENSPGYISCVKYVPNSEGKMLVACSVNGIFFSNDSGFSWKKLSEKGFHSLIFANEKTLVASGENNITIFKIKYN